MDAQPPRDRGKPLRVQEVAERIGVARKTVRALIQDGKIRAIQHGGKTSPWIVFEADLNDYIREVGGGPPDPATPPQHQQPLADREHYLYRFHDREGSLLYIGVTSNPSQRWDGHARTKQWWPEVETIAAEKHPDRRTALDAERAAILAERPRYNAEPKEVKP